MWFPKSIFFPKFHFEIQFIRFVQNFNQCWFEPSSFASIFIGGVQLPWVLGYSSCFFIWVLFLPLIWCTVWCSRDQKLLFFEDVPCFDWKLIVVFWFWGSRRLIIPLVGKRENVFWFGLFPCLIQFLRIIWNLFNFLLKFAYMLGFFLVWFRLRDIVHFQTKCRPNFE